MRPIFSLVVLVLPTAAFAGALDDYKDQKHTDRPRVTADTCEAAYIADRRLDPDSSSDRAKAAAFCEDRAKRKRAKTVEVVAKGASVAAGGAAVAVENAVTASAAASAASAGSGGSSPSTRSRTTYNGVTKGGSSGSTASRGGVSKGVPATSAPVAAPLPPPRDPYDFRPNFVAELGAGYPSRTFAGDLVLRGRSGRWGGGMTNVIFTDGDDWLNETDVGPMVYFDSRHIEFGLQPSLLISAGNGVSTELGGGARSFTTVELGRRFNLHFDPMLGYINHNWNYNLKAGVSYEITPNVYARVNYDYRDVLDLGDLEISQAAMHGVFANVGVKF